MGCHAIYHITNSVVSVDAFAISVANCGMMCSFVLIFVTKGIFGILRVYISSNPPPGHSPPLMSSRCEIELQVVVWDNNRQAEACGAATTVSLALSCGRVAGVKRANKLCHNSFFCDGIR